jgi:hypothetical protein
MNRISGIMAQLFPRTCDPQGSFRVYMIFFNRIATLVLPNTTMWRFSIVLLKTTKFHTTILSQEALPGSHRKLTNSWPMRNP